MLHHRLEKRAVIYACFLKFPIKSIISHKSFTKCLSHSGLFLLLFQIRLVGRWAHMCSASTVTRVCPGTRLTVTFSLFAHPWLIHKTSVSVGN